MIRETPLNDSKSERNVASTMRQTVDRELWSVLAYGAIAGASDAELLTKLGEHTSRDEAGSALRILIARHGSMVLGVCRRLLRDEHAAEDAFQATFLILIRKAGSVRVEGSVAPWLHGVATRVARRARSQQHRESQQPGAPPHFDHSAPEPTLSLHERTELSSVIDEEIDRLPSHYRQVLILCLVEGLTHDQAAHSLRCPMGTVQSRLHRAQARLRDQLARRGVAPCLLVSGLPHCEWIGEGLPIALAEATVDLLRLGIGGKIPASLLALMHITLRRMSMLKGLHLGLLIIGLASTGALAYQAAAVRDSQPGKDRPGRVATTNAPAKRSIADEFSQIKEEYDTKTEAVRVATLNVPDEAESMRLYQKLSPNELQFTRRMVELALRDPKDKAARDACVWVLFKPFMGDDGLYADEFGRAAAILLRHHADDPEAVRVGLEFHLVPTVRRDTLLHGFMAEAKGHEAKGLAMAALARYLESKALFAQGARNRPLRRSFMIPPGPGREAREEKISADRVAYELMLRESDPDFIRAEAERLYEDLIKDYGDVLYLTQARRELQQVLKDPKAKYKGRVLTAEERSSIEKTLSTTKSLADFARERLDEIRNLTIGKPAPEIVGTDLEGKPFKLSDFRGKAVLLVFWATWCGPCVREIPLEKQLVEKLKDKPFVLIGVNSDEKRETALEFAMKEKLPWRSWFDGREQTPIASLYHVEGYPSAFLIDAQGILRSKSLRGESMEKEVEKLLANPSPAAKP